MALPSAGRTWRDRALRARQAEDDREEKKRGAEGDRARRMERRA